MMRELLAPAGNRECLEAAIRFGADAVYLGGPSLQLRAGSTSFSMDELEGAIQYAHGLGKKVYVAVNAFAKNADIDAVPEYAKALRDVCADAVIISDIGVLSAVKRVAPGLEIHISTQANCLNYQAARTYHDLGASRIVLGREMTIEEIATLRAKTPKTLMLEAFVHGAMCMSYSGRCMMSAYMTGRSANRGDCAQPCRYTYHIVEEKRPNEFYPVYQDEQGMAVLSAYDLNAMPVLDRLQEAGVQSFKIEGRMKTAYYVATVVRAYRRYLDGGAEMKALLSELDAANHRPYSTGFYEGSEKKDMPAGPAYRQDCLFVGMVLAADEERLLVEVRNKIVAGDALEVLSPGTLGIGFTAKIITAEDGAPLQEAVVPMQRVYIKCPHALAAGDMLRKRI